ncbi:hypothetical protein [Flavihumibacter fluvii]|uniref:hypothetical protein n=1 Tax=Flavihumibacter fluvii TaxID=2838157 RepID=UPI001BDEC72B|nr:hypothetical protein [Flavihumibacter fluvii]ULQ52867.1 hypothetical protein KJS93_00845 [Flavihumibacter fluvii]
MRYFLPFLLAATLFSGAALAQSSGYLYIESEPSRPFYLRTRDSLYSSAAGNYLILAPLKNVTGEIIVGFPGSQAAFSFTLKDTSLEQGLILRDQKEEGWRLYDFRKNELVNVRRMGRQANELNAMVRRNDAFAVRLSQVVNDSIILYYQPAGTTVLPGTNLVKQLPAKAAESPKPAPLKPPSGVRRLSKLDMGNRWLILYEEREGETRDTIRVEIDKPVQKKKAVKGAKAGISAIPAVDLFSQYEQVFYRSNLSRNKLRRVSKAGECPYSAS